MIDVVIPTFRGATRVATCVHALGADGSAAWRAIVVDDGSGDGTAERIAAEHPDVELVALTANTGFPRAANAGLRRATSEVVVLLNDDMEVRPGFLAAVAAPFDDLEVGMVAPVILQADARSLEGIGVEADRALAGFSLHWGADPAQAAALSDRTLIGPSGGAAAYRRTALEAVGHLDEQIVAYHEDLDLAIRLRGAGWRCAAATDAVAVHQGSSTFGRRSARQLYAKGFSRAYLLRKYGVLRRPSALAAAVVGEATTVGWQLLKDRSTEGVRGRLAGWRSARGVHHPLPEGLLNPAITPLDAARRRRSYGG